MPAEPVDALEPDSGKRKRLLWTAIAVGGLFLVAGVGLGGWALLGSRTKPTVVAQAPESKGPAVQQTTSPPPMLNLAANPEARTVSESKPKDRPDRTDGLDDKLVAQILKEVGFTIPEFGIVANGQAVDGSVSFSKFQRSCKHDASGISVEYKEGNYEFRDGTKTSTWSIMAHHSEAAHGVFRTFAEAVGSKLLTAFDECAAEFVASKTATERTVGQTQIAFESNQIEFRTPRPSAPKKSTPAPIGTPTPTAPPTVNLPKTSPPPGIGKKPGSPAATVDTKPAKPIDRTALVGKWLMPDGVIEFQDDGTFLNLNDKHKWDVDGADIVFTFSGKKNRANAKVTGDRLTWRYRDGGSNYSALRLDPKKLGSGTSWQTADLAGKWSAGKDIELTIDAGGAKGFGSTAIRLGNSGAANFEYATLNINKIGDIHIVKIQQQLWVMRLTESGKTLELIAADDTAFSSPTVKLARK